VWRTEPTERLRDWLAAQVPGASDLSIQGFDHVTIGHSSETVALTLAWRAADGEHRRDVVLRARPAPPGLLEPYDLHRQFTILQALEATPVRAPRALWYEPTGSVLGREFYVMERLDGTVYEGALPGDLEAAAPRLDRMSRSLVDALAAIHRVDLDAVGLSAEAGRHHLERELAHWTAELQRVQRDRLPALERLAAELADQRPEPSSTITLVHGDPKPGNFAFLDDTVSAIFDWELATVGDPLADVGYLECMWSSPASFTSHPGAITVDEFVTHYERLTGHAVHDREWYRALQGFKLAVIMLVGAMLFDSGATDDLRMANMGLGVHPFTTTALGDLGVEPLDPGPVSARPERVRAARHEREETTSG
jgi:aminoglycoside phosphotransferase (APT) family kinase protein